MSITTGKDVLALFTGRSRMIFACHGRTHNYWVSIPKKCPRPLFPKGRCNSLI
ncbi:hypothetical protein D3C79_919910 [compost metagenome]